jgi:ubiquitin-protein ligase
MSISKLTQKRLAGELKLLQKEPLELVDTYPDEKDTLLWYFLVRGIEDSDYAGGFFIGKIIHNPEYPVKPPDFMMLTPNGRFDFEKKICLTNSSYHLESWSAAWNIRTMLLAFLSIMADDSTSGISHIKESPTKRKQLAKDSIKYNMTYHKDKWIKFERFVNPDGTPKSDEEIKKSCEVEPKKKKEKKEETDKEAVELKQEVKESEPIKEVKEPEPTKEPIKQPEPVKEELKQEVEPEPVKELVEEPAKPVKKRVVRKKVEVKEEVKEDKPEPKKRVYRKKADAAN